MKPVNLLTSSNKKGDHSSNETSDIVEVKINSILIGPVQ